LECPVLKFKHLDTQDLRRTAVRCGPGSKLLVLTDGLFARNGAVPPLAEYLRAIPSDAQMLVDDAHAAGVLGRRGRGSLEHCGLGHRRIIHTVTLSKSFGAYGGAILGSTALRSKIIEKSHLFAGSTALPLPLACAALQALEILKNEPSLKKRLWRNAQLVKSAVRAAGVRLPDTPAPIIPLRNSRKGAVSKLHRELLEAAIFPSFIKYPSGPAEGYFRFIISSEHSPQQLKNLASVLARCLGSENGWATL
jgi:7-keto-8-aminopelargonate synthetase-like enzyme